MFEESEEHNKLKSKDVPKYEAIKDMLRAAGYFRIRITTLSPFDKVVGGLCWCISNSNVDVDVDVKFEEDPDIGEKIAISERIITSLKLMKCPIKIEPVQIQGLDFDAIYNVFQWLIKKVFETREENKEKIKNFTEMKFSQSYETKIEKKNPYLEEMEKGYKETKRKFKSKKMKRNLANHVQTVLLEYGKEFKTKSEEYSNDSNNTDMTNVASSVSASNLSKIISQGSGEDILKEKEEYEKKSKELSQNMEGQDKFRHKQLTTQLKKQIENLKNEFLKAKKENDELNEKKNGLIQELKKYRDYNEKVQEKISGLEDIDKDDPLFIQLKKLIALNESLKKQESDFRENCKRQLEEFKELISKLESESKGDDFKKYKDLENNYQLYIDKLKKIKQLSSKRNREIALLQRKIDEVPSRIEINQYEKRFKELYGQIVSKLDETRKYYDTYNCLSDKIDYLKKESYLLNAVHEGFQKTIGKKVTKEYRQWLIDTSKKSVDAVIQNKVHIEKRANLVQTKRDNLQDNYNKLVTQQRRYYTLLKEFQEECKKNELLNKK